MTSEGQLASSPQPVDVGVVIVTYNSAEHLPALLASLAPAAGGCTLRVVVIDNGSMDNSAEIARRSGAVVVVAENGGYAAGINRARPWVRDCRAVLIANPDLQLKPGAIEAMFQRACEQTCVVAPRITDPSGNLRRTLHREPTISRQFGEALFGDRWPRRPAWLAVTERANTAYRGQRTADWASGAVLMVPRQVDRAVGHWDESFFLYSEEVDFARRARMAGHPLAYEPVALAMHVEGGSGVSDRLFALLAVNRVRYYAKWHSRASTAIYSLAVLTELLLRLGVRSRRRALPDVLRACLASITGSGWRSGPQMLGAVDAPLRSRGHEAPV